MIELLLELIAINVSDHLSLRAILRGMH